MPYVPTEPAGVQGLSDALEWALRELRAIASELSETQALELRPSGRAPQRPREGMIVYADGVGWNPGSGVGPYIFKGGVWVYLL